MWVCLNQRADAMDRCLGPNDLSRLNGEYFYARSEWKTIGCTLGISADDLEVIDKDNRKCEDCFREVLLKWLRRQGNKTETELIEAISKAAKVYESQKNTTFYYISASVIVLLAAFSSLLGHRYVTTDPMIAAAENLKAWYKNQPVIGFKLLDYATDMPFINVTMEGDRDLWKLLYNIDLKHQHLQRNPTAKGKLKRLVITGHPGAGKTTLMRHLAKEWANGRVLPSCQILFLIHLDTLPKKDIKPSSLSDLLEMSPLKDYMDNVEQISVKIMKHGAGACFLLDSYDGWHWSNDIIYDMIFKAKLHSSLCILTSRPSKAMSEQSYAEHVQILGFDSTHLEEYLHTLSTDEAVTNSISDLWESNENVKEMCGLPLNMVMLIFIAKHGGKLDIRTKTEIYLSFVDTIIKHFDDHHPQWNTVSLRECMSNMAASPGDDLCVAFKHLHFVAFEMQFDHEDEFPDYLKINENINKLGFVNITKIKSVQDRVRYTFFHPTFLEFFTAIHVLTLTQEQQLYLYIKSFIKHHRAYNYETSQVWLFYFGLVSTGEYYRNDISLSAAVSLKQFNVFSRGTKNHPSQYLLGCNSYGILEYIQELNWNGKRLDKLLESTRILMNSSLCVERIFSLNEFNGFMYILEHANVKEFRLGNHKIYFIFKATDHNISTMVRELSTDSFRAHLSNNNLSFEIWWVISEILLKISNSLNTLKLVDPLRFDYGTLSIALTSAKSVHHLHFDVSGNYDLEVLNFLLKKITNLYSLHIGLGGLNFEAVSTLIDNNIMCRRSLQILDMTVDLRCSKLPDFMRKIINLPNKLILTLKIHLTMSQVHEGVLCQKVASQLGTYTRKQSHRLKELILVLPKAPSPVDWITLQLFTGLKHLTIGFNSLWPISDKVLDRLHVLSELVSLEIHNTQFGTSAMNSLLRSLSQLKLQKLALDHDNLTDYAVGLLAMVLNSSMYELESLSLQYNSITGTGVKSLVNVLKSHGNFHSLDLSGNPLTENEGLEMLKELNFLCTVNLTNCDIGDVDFEKLANALSTNKNLHFLNLSGNPL